MIERCVGPDWGFWAVVVLVVVATHQRPFAEANATIHDNSIWHTDERRLRFFDDTRQEICFWKTFPNQSLIIFLSTAKRQKQEHNNILPIKNTNTNTTIRTTFQIRPKIHTHTHTHSRVQCDHMTRVTLSLFFNPFLSRANRSYTYYTYGRDPMTYANPTMNLYIKETTIN